MIENRLKVFDCSGILIIDKVSETNLIVRKVVHTMDKKIRMRSMRLGL